MFRLIHNIESFVLTKTYKLNCLQALCQAGLFYQRQLYWRDKRAGIFADIEAINFIINLYIMKMW